MGGGITLDNSEQVYNIEVLLCLMRPCLLFFSFVFVFLLYIYIYIYIAFVFLFLFLLLFCFCFFLFRFFFLLNFPRTAACLNILQHSQRLFHLINMLQLSYTLISITTYFACSHNSIFSQSFLTGSNSYGISTHLCRFLHCCSLVYGVPFWFFLLRDPCTAPF